jgi:hypothetical protein
MGILLEVWAHLSSDQAPLMPIDLTIPGQMTEGELRAVEAIARRVPKHGRIVEAGSLYGRSSYVWASSADPTVSVYCIDPWVREQWVIDLVESQVPGCPPFSMAAFQKFTRHCSNIIPMQGRSPQDCRNWQLPIDVFFDDALHHNPFLQRNLAFWRKFVRPGGFICGHDYCNEWPDVVIEADALANSFNVSLNVRQWFWWIQVPWTQ